MKCTVEKMGENKPPKNNFRGENMEKAMKIVDEMFDEHGLEPVSRRIGDVAKWVVPCENKNAQDYITDWTDRVLPMNYTFGVERIGEMVVLTVKKTKN